MKTSVVIPSYNSREYISFCLEALSCQTLSPDEIIVIDSSNDDTPDIIRKRFPRVKLRHLAKQTMPGAARNLGIEAATSEIILFTDTDAVPHPDWVREHVRLHKDSPGVSVIGGAILNHNPEYWISRLSFISEFTGFSRNDKAGPRTMVPSVNMSVKRADVFRSGIRMPETALPGGEDVYFCNALIKLGYGIQFDPSPMIGHINRLTWSAFTRHMKSSGYAFGFVSGEHQVSYRFVTYAGPLAVLAAPVRLLIVWKRLLRTDLKAFAESLALAPVMLWGFAIFMWSYYRGARNWKRTRAGV